MPRPLLAVLVIAALVAASYALTNALDRRRARGRLTLESERTDPILTILAKRRAERRRQLALDPFNWD